MKETIPTRYSRQTILPQIKKEGQLQLMAAKVLVIGAGGLGSPVLTYLAAMGIGHIGVVEFDLVDETNLNRQFIYRAADKGKKKVDAAKKILTEQNPLVNWEFHDLYINRDNVIELIMPYDIVVDGSDNFDTRYLLNDACILADKVLVSGAIHQFHGQVSVFNYQQGPTYRCIFPQQPEAQSAPNCAEAGIMGATAGVIGSLQAMEVVKVICGIGEVLSGKLLLIDLLHHDQQLIQFKLNPENRTVKSLPFPKEERCFIPAEGDQFEDSPANWKTKYPEGILLDIREDYEQEEFPVEGSHHVPLSTLPDYFKNNQTKSPMLVFCQNGIKSKTACLWIKENYPSLTVSELAGGIDKYQN
ncbi:HesA/MoeB/ThiF family protein [Persicobacter psychrovividus]